MIIKKIAIQALAIAFEWAICKGLDLLLTSSGNLSLPAYWQSLCDFRINIFLALLFVALFALSVYVIWFWKNRHDVRERRILRKLRQQAICEDKDLGIIRWTVCPPNIYNADYHCANIKIKCPRHNGYYLDEDGYCRCPGCGFHVSMQSVRQAIDSIIYDQYLKLK